MRNAICCHNWYILCQKRKVCYAVFMRLPLQREPLTPDEANRLAQKMSSVSFTVSGKCCLVTRTFVLPRVETLKAGFSEVQLGRLYIRFKRLRIVSNVLLQGWANMRCLQCRCLAIFRKGTAYCPHCKTIVQDAKNVLRIHRGRSK